MKQLILGGARSGKSSLAERLAGSSGKQVIVIATATADDAEMAERIQRHKTQRPSEWKVIEESLLLPDIISKHSSPDHFVLVDCLTLWLSNLLHHYGEETLEDHRQQLVSALKESQGKVLLVSNEVGLGIVPLGQLSRIFVDHNGWINQAVAAVCDRVILTAAGLPLVLKGPPL